MKLFTSAETRRTLLLFTRIDWMQGRRKLAWVSGLAVVAAAVAAVSASTDFLQGAQQPPANAQQPIDGINPGEPGYLTAQANQEAHGKAPRGPWAYSGSSNYTRYFVGPSRSPEQPIRFPHPVHVNTLKLNCVHCHYSADKSPDPGIPAIETCMGCHNTVATARPEIVKLKAYQDSSRAIPWIRIHKVPDYVKFPHMMHVQAGVTCQSCHGQVQNMPQVTRYASLNMGWCVNCHVNGYSRAEGMRAAGYQPTPEDLAAPVRKARYDCATCHY